MKKYIVYQITNQLNNNFYIGVHQTYNINDRYMSSSNVVKNAIKKYGKENFKKEVLFEFDNAETMFAKEAEIVNKDFVKRNDTYNLKTGGTGSTSHLNDGSETHKQRCRDASKHVKNRYNISQHGEEFRFDFNKEHRLKAQAKANLPEAIAKKKEVFKNIKHQQGKKNSQYGKVWCIEKTADDYSNRKSFHPNKIPDDWMPVKEHKEIRKNKKNSAYGKKWYNDGHKSYLLKEDDQRIVDFSLTKGRIL